MDNPLSCVCPYLYLYCQHQKQYILQSISKCNSVSSILEKIALGVDAEVRHISKNHVVTLPPFASKILTVSGLIFCNLDQLVAKENRFFFIILISNVCNSLAKAPFSMQAVFV